jgi:hypothetical protein
MEVAQGNPIKGWGQALLDRADGSQSSAIQTVESTMSKKCCNFWFCSCEVPASVKATFDGYMQQLEGFVNGLKSEMQSSVLQLVQAMGEIAAAGSMACGSQTTMIDRTKSQCEELNYLKKLINPAVDEYPCEEQEAENKKTMGDRNTLNGVSCGSAGILETMSSERLRVFDHSKGGDGGLAGIIEGLGEAVDTMKDDGKEEMEEAKDTQQDSVKNVQDTGEETKDALAEERETSEDAIKAEEKSTKKDLKFAEGDFEDEVDGEVESIADTLKDEGKSQRQTIDSYSASNRKLDMKQTSAQSEEKELAKKEGSGDKVDANIVKLVGKIDRDSGTITDTIENKVEGKVMAQTEKLATQLENKELGDIAKSVSKSTKEFEGIEKDSAKAEATSEKDINKETAKIEKTFRKTLSQMKSLTEDTQSVCMDCPIATAEKVAETIAGQVGQATQMYADAIQSSEANQDTDLDDISSSFGSSIDQLSQDTAAQVSAEMEALRKTTIARLDAPAQEGQRVLQVIANKVSQSVTQVDHAGNAGKSAHRSAAELTDATTGAELVQTSAMATLQSASNDAKNTLKRGQHEIQKVADSGDPADAWSGSLLGDGNNAAENVLVELKSKNMDEANAQGAVLINDFSKIQNHNAQEQAALQRGVDSVNMVSNQLNSGIQSIAQADLPEIQRSAYSAEVKADKVIDSANNTVMQTYRKLQGEMSAAAADSKKAADSAVDSLANEVTPVVQSQAMEMMQALNNIKSLGVEIEDKDKLHSQDIKDGLNHILEKAKILGENVEANSQYPKMFEDQYAKAEGEIGLGPISQHKAKLLEGLKSSERAVATYLTQIAQTDQKSTVDLLNRMQNGNSNQMDMSEKQLDDFLRSITANMAEHSRHVDEERQQIDAAKSETLTKVKGIEDMLKQLENSLHDSVSSLTQKVDQDLMSAKKSTAGLGDFSNSQLAKISGDLRAQLDHVQRVITDDAQAYDSSVLKQVDDTTFYLKHDRETNEKEVTQMLQLMADKETQVEAADKSAETAMTNGMERWAAGSEENKQRAELLMRQFAAQSSGTPPTEKNAGRQEVSGERMSAAIDTLGSQSDSVSGEAADQVEIAGSSVTSGAKTSEAEITMQLSKVEAQEQKAFEEQNQRDRGLMEAVGVDIAKMNDVQREAMKDYAVSSAARSQVGNLVSNENESLDKNEAYLRHYMQITGEKMTQLMGQVAMQIEHAMHGMTKDQSDLEGVQTATEMRVDDLMGSDAIQSLQKIGRADDLSMKVEMEDEFLREWMSDFDAEAKQFRERVEKGFASSEEAMELHAIEIEKEEQEAKDRDGMLEGRMVKGIEGMAKQVDFEGVDGVEKGFQAGIDAFNDKTKVTNELDNTRIEGLSSTLNSVQETFGTEYNNAKDAMNHLRNDGKEEAQNMMKLKGMLDGMIKFHDAQAAEQRKELSRRQQSFQNDLLFAGMPGGAVVETPTAEQTQALLDEAQSLSAKHSALEAKREEIGNTVGTLLQKINDVVAKVHADQH